MKDYECHPRTGEILPNNSDNIAFFLKSIRADIRWNAWSERVEMKSIGAPSLPSLPRWSEWTPVNDTMVSQLRTFAARTGHDFRPTKEFFWDVLLSLAHVNIADPALDLLAELEAKWDGIERLDSWLLYACNAPDDEYHQAVGRNIIGGMVRRIREPGCKHDTVALLIGDEGSGKSSLAAMLAPRPEWFADTIQLGDESKELVLAMAGKAVIEISEMSASTRDVAKIKAMLSRTTDSGRTAYARTVSDRPRRNIFVASTNDEKALVSSTGNRRFLPVKIEGEIELEWLRVEMPRLMGEAAHLHSRGETFAMPRNVWIEASGHQESARQQSDHEIYFAEWFAPSDLSVFISAADLRTLVRSVAPHVKSGEYIKTLRGLGFVEAAKRIGGKPAKVWHRGDLSTATQFVPRLQRDGILAPSLYIAAESQSSPGVAPLPPLPVT